MANCNPPVKNQAFDLSASLWTTAGAFVANPGTVTAKISKDFGDWNDVGTVTEEDSTYGQLKLALSATEMNADVVDIYVVDNTAGCIPYRCTIYTCSATRGLAGTALPAAAADAAGGLVISDAGGLDADALVTKIGTPVNTGGTASLAAILGNPSNVSLATTLGAVNTNLGTPVNTGGTATFAALFGDMANSALVTRLGTLATAASITTLTNRLGTWTGTGVNTVLGAFKALLSKAATLPTDIGGTFSPVTDSTEALQEQGAAIKAITDTLAAVTVTVSSPVDVNGNITIYAGDDYVAAEARQVSFAVSDASHLLGLTNPAASAKLKLEQATFTATAITSTTPGYTIVFEPTRTQTAALTSYSQDYELELTTAAGSIATVATGKVTLIKDIPAVTP